MTLTDTIAAISSSVGPSARIIVRLSGPMSIDLAHRLHVPDGPGGDAVRCEVFFRGIRLPSWVYLFRAPHSYSGEDLVEFHIPGNSILAKMLLEELLKLGARPAEAGEFTARAYFNGKMDLTVAEGVAIAVAAGNEQELSAARRLLSGELARRLVPIMDLLADTMALVEVGIDFSEEDVSFLSEPQIRQRIGDADEALDRLLAESTRFERLVHEPEVVLVGRPNAGKSTLLNTLAGHERAIVSPVAGTTRDVLWAEVALESGIIRVIDVAGIDQRASADEIEQQMQSQASRAIETADVLVLVRDITDSRPALSLPRAPQLVVRTKCDLPSGAGASPGVVSVSALTGAGMEELRSTLNAVCFHESATGSSLALNVRHVRAIDDARDALSRAKGQLGRTAPEVIALELREALDALGQVLGRITPDEVLGRIFSGFCIGK